MAHPEITSLYATILEKTSHLLTNAAELGISPADQQRLLSLREHAQRDDTLQGIIVFRPDTLDAVVGYQPDGEPQLIDLTAQQQRFILTLARFPRQTVLFEQLAQALKVPIRLGTREKTIDLLRHHASRIRKIIPDSLQIISNEPNREILSTGYVLEIDKEKFNENL